MAERKAVQYLAGKEEWWEGLLLMQKPLGKNVQNAWQAARGELGTLSAEQRTWRQRKDCNL